MKKAFLLIISAALLLTSCSWFNNDPIQPLPIPVIPQFNTFTITGKLGTNGAMPENYAQVMNSRTAIATAPTGQTIQYKVLLLAEDGVTAVAGATSNISTDANGDMSYTIKYVGTDTTARQYWLRAVAYYMDGTNEIDILVSPDTQLDTAVDLKGDVYTKDLEMRPSTTGVGKVALTITLEDSSMCDTVSIDDVTHFNITKSGTTVTITHVNIAADNPNVACGSYPVTVTFYKSVVGMSIPVLKYQFEDVINVFNNLTTNTWVDNGNSPHLTTESGVTTCNISNAKLADFNATNFYVDSTASVSGSGTYISPFNSIQNAIQYINALGSSTDPKYYTIHLKGNGETLTSGFTIGRKITLEAYATVPGAKDGVYQFSLATGTVFTVMYNGFLAFKSNGQALGSGYPTGATKGIVISGATIGVQINNGKFEMEGGYISCSNVGVDVPASTSIFEMSGGYINGNTSATSGGVSVGTNGTFRIRGKPVITGGTKPVYLNTNQKIKVVGPLFSGALIGVATQTPPTATESVTITSGYGYQTGGYNAGVLPGTYFRGVSYGVIQDGDPNSGEAILKISGGSITSQVRDDITIDIDRTAFLTTENSKAITFTVTKDKGITDRETDITGESTYSYVLQNHGQDLADTYYPQNPSNPNKITLSNSLPSDSFMLSVSVIYEGNAYNSSLEVKIVDPNTTVVSEPVNLPSGTTGTGGTTSTYMYFGSWPQTIKTENVKVYENVTKTQGDFTYCLGSDGEWYVSCIENANQSGYTYSDNTSVALSSANSTKYFKVEPIKWRVVTTNHNGKKLLVSEKILIANIKYLNDTGIRESDGHPDHVYPNIYKYSNIRAWLNGIMNQCTAEGGSSSSSNIDWSNKGFYYNAFTASERSMIVDTVVGNSNTDTKDYAQVEGGANEYCSEDTTDKIFLLSKKEATTLTYGFNVYNATDTAKQREVTDYAKANFAYVNSGKGSWWLRSPSYPQWTAQYVRYDGNPVKENYNDDGNVTVGMHGIVPALCIEPQ